MLCTEEEARQKACHRTLCADIWSNPKENEGEANTAYTPCIASKCMAWRFSEQFREVGTDIKCGLCRGAGTIVTGSGEHVGGEECPHCVAGYQTEGVPLGYCGLIGDADHG